MLWLMFLCGVFIALWYAEHKRSEELYWQNERLTELNKIYIEHIDELERLNIELLKG